MSGALNLVFNHVTGYGPSNDRCLPCSGFPERSVTVSPSVMCGAFTALSQFKTASLKHSSLGATFACKATSSGHKKNPDFSQQKNLGFSRNRNRQNEDRYNSELEESDMLSSKNGPSLSFSDTPKHRTTSAPGPRETEIVGLFRKVQAQLRERATVKEEKRIEALQGQHKDRETVDSLLKLLRNHSVEQDKLKVNGGSDREFWDRSERNGTLNAEKHTNSYGTARRHRDEPRETNASFFTRPLSNFRKKMPVPQVKNQPIYSDKGAINSIPHVNSVVNKTKSPNEPEHGLDPVLEPEAVVEPEPKQEPIFWNKDVYGEMVEDELSDMEITYDGEDAETQEPDQISELSALKIVELKVLAKSRGMKGFSKLKKSELLELLSGNSI